MDRSLIHAARNGDSRARDAVARWLYAELSAVHRHRPHEQFDELMQEAVTEIFEKLAKAPDDDPVAFRAWALRFAGMRARALKRDRDREHDRVPCRSPSHSPAESASVSVLGPLLDIEERQLVIDHAQQLQPIYRNAILHVLDGGNYKSLAATERVPEGTAARRITIATTQVRLSIEAARRSR
jgi:DNA-directed RNA polymerase specialized sigma24 family protein